jgi:hypothetical protein
VDDLLLLLPPSLGWNWRSNSSHWSRLLAPLLLLAAPFSVNPTWQVWFRKYFSGLVGDALKNDFARWSWHLSHYSQIILIRKFHSVWNILTGIQCVQAVSSSLDSVSGVQWLSFCFVWSVSRVEVVIFGSSCTSCLQVLTQYQVFIDCHFLLLGLSSVSKLSSSEARCYSHGVLGVGVDYFNRIWWCWGGYCY